MSTTVAWMVEAQVKLGFKLQSTVRLPLASIITSDKTRKFFYFKIKEIPLFSLYVHLCGQTHRKTPKYQNCVAKTSLSATI